MMKTGFTKYFRAFFTQFKLLQFALYRRLLGFEYANGLLTRMDKHSTVAALRKNGAQIGQNCDIESGLIFHNCLDYTNLSIGDNCHIGKNCFFDLRAPIVIHDNTVISMRCTFITHIDLTKSSLSRVYPSDSAGINIGEDCYLGANATILKGVTIGARSIVGANALVLKSCSENVILGGVPAKEIKASSGVAR